MDRSFGFNTGSQLQSHDPERLWENLALAAECMEPGVSASTLAQRLNEGEDAVRFTLPLSHAAYGIISASASDPAATRPIAARLSQLLLLVKPALLAGALRAEGDGGARRVLLPDAALVLEPAALTRVAFAAAAAWDQPFSAVMRELLRKLTRAASAGTEGAAAAETELRDLIGRHAHLARGKSDVIVRGESSDRRPKRAASRVAAESDRLLHLALETGATGELLWLAVDDIANQGRAREIFAAVKAMPDSPVSAAIVRRISSAAALNEILSDDPIDGELLDLVLRALGIAAAKPMIEVLAESRSRATRRAVLDRLSNLGDDIAPLVEARLRDSRWFVIRNMLTLLREAKCMNSARHASRFVHHTDGRVRREAILYMLDSPATAEEALLAGLRDPEKPVLRAALQAARSRLPEVAVPVLAQRLTEDATFPPEFRVMALHILGRSTSALALDALLNFAQGGRTMLGRPRLAQKSPEMLAAVSGLARSWSRDRRARALLDAAGRSRDKQISDSSRTWET